MTTTVIRPEESRDHEAIAKVVTSAFGRENEARLVEALRRSPEHLVQISLVAETAMSPKTEVVGHILFSRIAIMTPGGEVPALALAPMAVVPELQRCGIGSALVRHGLEASRKLGHRIVIVLGHPEYYPRFGFTPAADFGISPSFDAPREAFLVLELVPGAIVSGVVRYPPEFDEF